jgi:putative ABC transport system ATP-binding protein
VARRNVCLARALAVRPQVLLLDEPTSALDGDNTAVLVDLARAHLAENGSVVLVSHDLTIVRRIAEHVLVLDHGHLTAAGHPDQLDYLETR